jgi:hypothetical protein
VRAVWFEPDARVYTSTPTKIRALYRQRVRWNSSRVWLIGRFGASLLYKWQLGAVVFLDVALVLIFGGALLYFALASPVIGTPHGWLTFAVLGSIAAFTVRTLATLLGMLQERELPRRWHKLLALPLSGPYTLIFNISTTASG